MRASQALADAMGEGWTPAPTLAVSGGWQAAAECGRLRVAQWLRDSGEVRYTAALDAGGPSGATPREAAARLRRELESLVETLRLAEGAS